MSDIIDDANDTAELYLKSAIHKHKAQSGHPAAKGNGLCLECGVKVKGGRRWCSPECRDYWEEENE